MNLAAALIYWVIIAAWLAVMATVAIAYRRNSKTFGTSRLLLAVVAIDTIRNIIENAYFGTYFGAQYGLFSSSLIGVLGNPQLLILPKLMNIVAAAVVFGLLLLRWLPLAQREKIEAETSLEATTRALMQEVEENRRLFDTSIDLIVVTDRDRIVTRISASSMAILGYKPDEIIGRYGGDFVAPASLGRLQAELELTAMGKELRNFRSEFLHRDGRAVTLSWSGVWSEQEQRFFLIGRDITKENATENKLRELAHFDQLTMLPNRSSFMMDMADILKPVNGIARSASIALFDLDDFKEINDTLGHSIGDKLLLEVSARVAEIAPEPSRVYRLGGDEFVLVIPDCRDPIFVSHQVDLILRAIEACTDIHGSRISISASAGIAIAPADGRDPEELILSADLALYDAKASGGRKKRLFLPAMRAAAHARRQLESELQRATAENQFELYFQPQIRLSDGMVTGAEALIRWKHPNRGLLTPAAFIGALEHSSDALQVGRWVLQTACKTAVAWHAKGYPLLRMGVNFFPTQFEQDVLLGDIEYALESSGLPPQFLEIEITENVAIGNYEKTNLSLCALRKKGVGVAFDDFGTGYASLSCLTQYPLTRIKIDRGFVGNVRSHEADENTAIITSIIVMAHNLGLEVVAEGVETPLQEAFLRNQGCDEVQGFLHAKPLSADDFERFLANRLAIAKPAIRIA